MAARPRVVVTGLRSIDRRLRALPLKIQKRVVTRAMRVGMKILQAAAKAAAPVLTGTMRRKVIVRAGLKKRRNQVSIDVRVEADDQTKRTSAKTGKTVFYPAIVEYKYHWMRKAFRGAGDAARRATIRAIRAGIERAAKSP